MSYQIMAETAVSSAGAVYFVGPREAFTKVALRTVETELDAPAQRLPDLEALRFKQMSKSGVVQPAYMVVVHESLAESLLDAVSNGAEELPEARIAIAFDDEEIALERFAEIREELLAWQISLLPMNINVTNWVRLLQVIQSGGHYMPPRLLQVTLSDVEPVPLRPVASAAAPCEVERPPARLRVAAAQPAPVAEVDPVPAPQDGLTPREAEVLAMAAAGNPNKMIAGALELSEHTVKLYMHRVINKLGVKNRTEAAVWFHRNGLSAGA